jgi:hypothetical protein
MLVQFFTLIITVRNFQASDNCPVKQGSFDGFSEVQFLKLFRRG